MLLGASNSSGRALIHTQSTNHSFWRRVARCWAAVTLLAFAVGCSRTPEIEAVSARVRSREIRPIILITLDTFRRDHVGAYGYFRDTTPSMDAFAAESVRFDRAVATAPVTLPSHMSMMTGLYVHQHGVFGNHPRSRSPLEAQAISTWVPSILSGAGYETAAFVSALVLGPETGMSQGFEVFDAPTARRKGIETTELALKWLAERTDRPFLLWVHLFDPHEPNEPSSPYAEMFTSDARLDAEIDSRGIRPERIAADETKGGICRVLFPDLLPRLAEDQALEIPPIDRASIRDLLNRYDGDVRYTDDCVGRIVAALKQRGLWERAIVAIVGDHGQSLGQNDWLTHGRITNENLLVPMMIHFPKEMLPQPLVVASTASTIDLFPTILGAFEHETLQNFVRAGEGVDAFDMGMSRTFAIAQGALRKTDTRPAGAVTLIGDRWRYEDTGDGTRLYDLASDPNAEHDVSASNADRAAEFKAALASTLARRAKPLPTHERPSKISREHVEALKDLGYAGD